MRHGVRGRKLNRPTGERLALLRGLARALFEHEVIQTTEARAKAVRPFVDRLITRACEGTLPARARLVAVLQEDNLVDKMIHVYGSRYKDRHGGYTRMVRVGIRRGDAAPLVRLELVGREKEKSV
ncbi:MAG: 50S ribosomal protein L17 [bacterium]|nr:50S ribosomal protein L17 [bacterium]